MSKKNKAIPGMFDKALVKQAIIDSFVKLNPKTQVKNQVMFLVYLGSIFTTCLCFASMSGIYHEPVMFSGSVAIWLWFTVLFANFAEAMAEGRAKARQML